ncbi:MAG: CvpA family protein [Desulfobacterales bacterium]
MGQSGKGEKHLDEGRFILVTSAECRDSFPHSALMKAPEQQRMVLAPIQTHTQPMNPLDIIILVIVGFCLIRGIFRGLVKELASITGVIAGLYGAYTYYSHVGSLFSKWISNPAYRHILGFLLIFFFVLILVAAIGVLIKYVLKIAHLGWFDRIFGSGFGFIKGILIVSVIVFMLTTFLPKGTVIIRESQLARHAMVISEKFVLIVPDDMKKEFRSKFDALKKSWQTGKHTV